MSWQQRSLVYATQDDETLWKMERSLIHVLQSGEGMSFEERETRSLMLAEVLVELAFRDAERSDAPASVVH